MRGSFQPPAHRSTNPPRSSIPLVESWSDEAPERPYFNRPCYEFNARLGTSENDRHCVHCRHYLTPRCPELAEFLDDVDDLSPE